jgi:hypothetical protein
MSDEVEVRLKPQDPCGCGCGATGQLKSPWKDGSQCVIHKCKCRRCQGRRNRKSGLAAQRIAAERLGVPVLGSLRPGNEEDFGGLVRMESKSGAIVRPLFTAYMRAEQQSEASRARGDLRPFVFTARMNPEGKDGLIVLRESKLEETVFALAVQLGLIEE